MAQKTTEKRQIPKEVSYTIIVIGLVLGMVIFSLSYLGMRYGYFLGEFNQPTLHWMVNHRNDSLTEIMKLITDLTNPVVLAPLIGIGAIIWAYIKKGLWRPIILLGSMALALLLSTVIKITTMDPRPAKINMIPAFETDFSFPSGHTIGIATFLLVLGYLIYSRNFNAKNFTTWVLIAIAGTGLIATSRLYLGYHWLTDVMASVGLAMIILAVAVSVDLFAYRKKLGSELQD